MSKRFQRNRQFVVAVSLAAIYAMDSMSLGEVFAAARMLIRSILARRGMASHKMWIGRLKCCYRCEVFVRATLSCGSPISTHGLGCNCFMPAKARLTEAKCWANENPEMNITGWTKNNR